MANKNGKIVYIAPLKGVESQHAAAFVNKFGAILEFGGLDPNMTGQAILRMSTAGAITKTIGINGQTGMSFQGLGQIYLTKNLAGQLVIDMIGTGRLRKLFRQNKYNPIHRLVTISSNNQVWYEAL